MPAPPRQMHLTPAHVARVPTHEGTIGLLSARPDRPTDADCAAIADRRLEKAPEDGEIWIVACGSRIWNPVSDFVENRLSTASGWHRALCLGWVRLNRGTPERPGVMLALDHGDACRCVVFRLPADAIRPIPDRFIRREMPLKRPPDPFRWIAFRIDQGSVRAIAFPINPQSEAYLPGLTEEQIVNAIATAAGERRSMAGYIYSTVRHLDDRCIQEPCLRYLQSLVAGRIDSLWPAPEGAP
jgi:glutathione-specific gamma-glutamylcyclotransferase